MEYIKLEILRVYVSVILSDNYDILENIEYMHRLFQNYFLRWKFCFQNNHLVSPMFLTVSREKLSSGPGLEPWLPALCACALLTASPRRIAGQGQNFSLVDPHYLRSESGFVWMAQLVELETRVRVLVQARIFFLKKIACFYKLCRHIPHSTFKKVLTNMSSNSWPVMWPAH